jgi:predicted membrane protein
MEESRSRNRVIPGELVAGGILIVIGLMFLLDNLNIFETRQFFRFWPTLLIAVGVFKFGTAADAHARVSSLFWVALGGLLLVSSMGFVHADIWSLFWPLVLIWFGLSMFWRKLPAPEDATVDGSGFISATSCLGGVVRKVASKDFRNARIHTLMGAAALDFREAAMQADEASVDLNILMGGATIRVPQEWIVESKVTPLMGGFEDKSHPLTEAKKRLLVRGTVIMGGVEVKN